MSISACAKPQDQLWMKLADWMKRHERLLEARDQQRDAQLVFLGDSITEGWSNVGLDSWNRYFANAPSLNLGISGDETQHILWRIAHGALDGLSPKTLILLIGTNNIGNSFMNGTQAAEGVVKVVTEIRRRLPQTQILLLAILPRDFQPDTPFRREIATANQVIAQLHDGQKVKFVDFAPLFLEPDGRISGRWFPDSLHLSAEAYEKLASELKQALA